MYDSNLFPSYRKRLVAMVACLSALALSAQPSATEYQVKAAYLFNFGKFVKWPSPPPSDSFSICVLGTDPFGPVLDATVRDEKIDDRPTAVRRIAHPQEAAGCQIVFISSSEAQAKKLIPLLPRAGVLTVSDMPGFLDHGGMIQFTFAGNRIRFEVNLDAVQESQLTLSSELLKVAGAVRRRRQAETR